MTRPSLPALLTALALSTPLHAAHAAAPPAVDGILQRLAASASPEQTRQIADAVNASPRLARQFEQLAAAGKFTGIRVVAPELLKPVRNAHFSAYLDGTQIVISTALLKELARPRLYDVVGKDDLLPNNTSFVLAHLAHHLASADDMKAGEAKAQFQIEALKKNPGKHDFRPIMEANAWAHLGDEAAALIDAWNATVDAAATQARAAMKIQQLPSFLMNLRYRGIFLQAVKQSPPHQLKIGEGGRIAPTQDNVRALAETLKTSQVMDVQ